MTEPRCPETTRHTPIFKSGAVGIQCRYTKGHHGQHCGSSFSTGDVFWDNPVLPTPTPPDGTGQAALQAALEAAIPAIRAGERARCLAELEQFKTIMAGPVNGYLADAVPLAAIRHVLVNGPTPPGAVVTGPAPSGTHSGCGGTVTGGSCDGCGADSIPPGNVEAGTVITMENKTWTTIDKTAWGPGPWQDEPDKEQWADEATGYPCLLKRNHSGALCGYVGVTEGHPWFGKDYDDVRVTDDKWPDVHGGLTYAGYWQDGPDRVWWLGFDCAHYMDIVPGMTADLAAAGISPPGGGGRETYRTVAYVKAECASLAQQAKAAAP